MTSLNLLLPPYTSYFQIQGIRASIYEFWCGGDTIQSITKGFCTRKWGGVWESRGQGNGLPGCLQQTGTLCSERQQKSGKYPTTCADCPRHFKSKQLLFIIPPSLQLANPDNKHRLFTVFVRDNLNLQSFSRWRFPRLATSELPGENITNVHPRDAVQTYCIWIPRAGAVQLAIITSTPSVNEEFWTNCDICTLQF